MSETQQNPDKLTIVSVSVQTPRSLRLEFSNGHIRLFDSHRLRGPAFIPLTNEKIFTAPVVKDGNLGWEELDAICSAKYAYDHSVPYDEHAKPKEYTPTRNDIIGERIAVILFPIMVIAGITGIIVWYMNQ